jgi:glycosyltransferase involved in cell wall biosynthesis
MLQSVAALKTADPCMHVLYIHPNFPAQFGPVATHLARTKGWRCTAVAEPTGGQVPGVEAIRYKTAGGARAENHFCSRTFENAVWHCDAVFGALARRPDIRPDLIVGHSGFGSTLFLRELYPNVPILNLFEYYYRPGHSEGDMDFRRDLAKVGWRCTPQLYQRARCRNAMILLDLENCDAGLCPTQFQRSTFPARYRDKLNVNFDGVWRPHFHGYQESLRPPPASRLTRTLCGKSVPAGTRVVTYVSRAFESMRGFDQFMRVARLIARNLPDVIFFVVGGSRSGYGGDENHMPKGTTFKEWALANQGFDSAELSRFVFTGQLRPDDLGRLLASTDLHIYLTAPFVLSWSMVGAMSCGAVVLGSATAPVEEMVRDGENGMLSDFFDPDTMASRAVAALRKPSEHRPLGRAAEQMVVDHYSTEAVLPDMVQLYQRVSSCPVGIAPT